MSVKKVVLFYYAIECPGGAERLLFEECLFFKQLGYLVKIITFKINREALFEYPAEDIEVISANRSFFSEIYQLRKKLSDLKPDLLIAVSGSGSIQLYLATISLCSYVLHIHGSLFWFDEDKLKYSYIHRKVFNEIRASVIGHKQFIPNKPKLSLRNRVKLEISACLDLFAVRKASRLIVLTPQIQWEVKKLYNRTSIIAKGCLNTEIFNYRQRSDIRKGLKIPYSSKVILSVSRLDRRKRLDVLIQAFAIISTANKNAYLIIAGTGPDMLRLKSLAENLDCSDRIVFAGFVNDDELWDYYCACDVFAFPGWTTSPITTYEALALNKKVVWSSEASEPDDILKDPHVFLSDPTVEDFAIALQKALDSPLKDKPDLMNYTWRDFFETCRAEFEMVMKG